MKKSTFFLYFAISLAIVVVSLPLIPKRGTTQINHTTDISKPNKTKPQIIDINNATFDQLINLPKIGPAIAKRIIDYRSKTPFERKTDIMKVSGIGSKTYDKIKDLIFVKDEKPKSNSKKININTANMEELITLPGIGEVYAKRIMDYRKEHKFKSITEIVKVKGIGEKTYQKLKDKITVQ
jgi:competence protein ComEA